MTAMFPSGLSLADARRLLAGVVVETATIRLGPDGQTGTMLAPPWEQTVTNLTRSAVILDGGTRRHTSINLATGASAPKHGVVVKMAPPQAQRLRDLLGVQPEPIPAEAPPGRVSHAKIKETHCDLVERNPLDDSAMTPPQRVVMVPRGLHVSPESVLDTLHDLRTDALALHVAALDTLARCQACACGAVSTVVDRVARRYVCDACAPEHARGNDQPWAPLARAMARMVTLPGVAP